MTDSPLSTATVRPRRRFAQFSLLTLLLLMAVIAVWTSYFTNRRQLQAFESRIKALKPLARELIIDDRERIAVVKRDELWYDENIWSLYLPSGQYRLCLATHEVGSQDLAPVSASASLAGGTHELQFVQKKEGQTWRLSVTSPGEPFIEFEEPKSWDPSFGSVGGGHFSECSQLPVDKPVILMRRRFSQRNAKGQHSTPAGPTEGVLLWIERVSDEGN